MNWIKLGNVVSLMMWVLFPFVATLGTIWRLMMVEK